MNLLFFGSSSRQLFGAYHTPPPTVIGRGAAVVCPSWGSEYQASHRILRRLAARLSETGFHVLRFDYHGTGDSAGQRDEGDLATWSEDASTAVDELRDMSGCPTVVAIGIRLGAAIGWRLAATRPDVRTVVMWDPVVNGRDYVRGFIAAQAETERWFLTPRPSRSATDELDLLGFPLTATMRSSIEAIEPSHYRQAATADVALFYSEMPTDVERLHQVLKASGTSFHAETVPGQPAWRETRTVVNGGAPFAMVERIVERLQ
jgi:pimeloyl-ACP methyl ester carboxylesterase